MQSIIRLRLHPKLFDASHILQRPDPENNFTDDLLLGHAAQSGTAGVHRSGPMVTHHKDLPFRNLIRKFNGAVAQSFLRKIGLLQHLTINIYSAFHINVYPISRVRNYPLHQDLVVVVERNNVPLFKFVGLQLWES